MEKVFPYESYHYRGQGERYHYKGPEDAFAPEFPVEKQSYSQSKDQFYANGRNYEVESHSQGFPDPNLGKRIYVVSKTYESSRIPGSERIVSLEAEVQLINHRIYCHRNHDAKYWKKKENMAIFLSNQFHRYEISSSSVAQQFPQNNKDMRGEVAALSSLPPGISQG